MTTYTTQTGTHVQIKTGASVENVDESVLDTIVDAMQPSYEERSNLVHFVITSGSEGRRSDGVHSWGSKHYEANQADGEAEAIDFRVWGFDTAERAAVAEEVRERLGGAFDVVDEGTHIHIEHDPT